MSKHDKLSQPALTTISTTAPGAKTVFVAGTFNDWNPESHPLSHLRDGRWALALDVPPGRHEYKFIIDGQWCCEQGCDKPHDGCPECVANELGTMNRVLIVEEAAGSRQSAQPAALRPSAITTEFNPKVAAQPALVASGVADER